MKIEFDKALLWLVPYLYLVSVVYYWGFWGTFDIDAFNYYPVSDLVKGVTFSLGKVVVITTFAGISGILSKIPTDKIDYSSAFVKKNIFYLLGILSIATVLLFFQIKSMLHGNNTLANISRSEDYRAIYFVISVGIIVSVYFINDSLVKLSFFQSLLRYTIILFGLFLPWQSYNDGRERAWLIKNDINYDYVIADSLSGKNNDLYKYLGKAGDYHILLTQDNVKRIIISSSKLTPLVIENFSVDDSESVKRFNVHKSELKDSLPKQPLVKKAPAVTPPQQLVQPK